MGGGTPLARVSMMRCVRPPDLEGFDEQLSVNDAHST
jgi:hypothetical protein